MRPLDEDVFEEIFQPIDAPDGSMLWGEFPVLVDDEHIWTVFDDDCGLGLVAVPFNGSRSSSDIGYVVTAVSWKDFTMSAWYLYEGQRCRECGVRWELESIPFCETCDVCKDCCKEDNHK